MIVHDRRASRSPTGRCAARSLLAPLAAAAVDVSRSASPPSTGSAAGRRASSQHVRGLPHGSEPRQALLAPGSGARPRPSARSRAAHGGTSAVYVQDLADRPRRRLERGRTLPGRLDAQARDRRHRPARSDGRQPSPARGSTGLLGEMLIRLRQRRRERARGLARRLDVGRLGARQRDDARARAERLADVRRLRDDATAGGRAAPIPIRIESQPASGSASTRRPGIWRGSPARSTSPRPGRGRCSHSASAARRRATCCGCSRRWPTAASSTGSSAAAAVVMHKAGWLPTARHDNGIVAFADGACVVTVMTWRTPGGGRAGRAESRWPRWSASAPG